MTRYVSVPVTGDGIDALCSNLRMVFANGGVQLAKFRAADVEDPSLWFRTGTKTYAFDSFRTLLESPAARAALPDLQIPDPFPIPSPTEFSPTDRWWTLMLDGWLASLLMHGGAYTRFTGSAVEAKAIGIAAALDLVQERHADFEAYQSWDPWTPWFFDIAWDITLVLVDRGRLEVTILCLTDTD